MKVLSQLPATPKQFHRIQGTERWKYVWEDNNTPLLRIYSDVPEPWGKDWGIRVRVSMGKHRSADYAMRLDLQCHPHVPERDIEVVPAIIHRDMYPAKLAYSIQPTLRFFALPGTYVAGLTWVMISVIEKGK